MSRISIAFFGAAVLYALAGVGLGMFMGATGDHSGLRLHAHINLISLGLMGAFYGLAGARTPAGLAWANFAALNVGALMQFSMLALMLQGKPPILAILIPGDVLIALGMLLFGIAVLVVGRRSAA